MVLKKSIEFETIHHKLYLINKPAEVQRFGISRGYNMLILDHGMEIRKFIFCAVLGSVLLHPESTIRGMVLPRSPGFDWKEHKLKRVLLNLAFSKQIKWGKYFFVNTEAHGTVSVVNAPIVNGHARVHTVVFHLILGPGFNWCIR